MSGDIFVSIMGVDANGVWSAEAWTLLNIPQRMRQRPTTEGPNISSAKAEKPPGGVTFGPPCPSALGIRQPVGFQGLQPGRMALPGCQSPPAPSGPASG